PLLRRLSISGAFPGWAPRPLEQRFRACFRPGRALRGAPRRPFRHFNRLRQSPEAVARTYFSKLLRTGFRSWTCGTVASRAPRPISVPRGHPDPASKVVVAVWLTTVMIRAVPVQEACSNAGRPFFLDFATSADRLFWHRLRVEAVESVDGR